MQSARALQSSISSQVISKDRYDGIKQRYYGESSILAEEAKNLREKLQKQKEKVTKLKKSYKIKTINGGDII